MSDEFDPNRLTLLPSGYFGKSSDLIHVVENFLSEEEVDKLLFAAKNLDIWKESAFRNKYSDLDQLKIKHVDIYNLLDNASQRFQKIVSDFFNVKIKTYMNPMSKWPINGDQRPHADKEWPDGSAADQNYYDIGSVIYLNNDFNGGEISFPDHGKTIKPTTNNLIIFPSHFTHEVFKVLDKDVPFVYRSVMGFIFYFCVEPLA